MSKAETAARLIRLIDKEARSGNHEEWGSVGGWDNARYGLNVAKRIIRKWAKERQR